MKKMTTVFLAVMMFAACGAVFAAEAQSKSKSMSENKRTIFAIGIFPSIPNSTNTYDVYGLKLGIPAVGGNEAWVCGQEASILYS